MFEQSVVEARGLAARPWTLAASLTMQTALISVAVLLPLAHPEMLQKMSVWIPVVSPPHGYRPPAAQRAVATRAATTRRVFTGFFAPASVPRGTPIATETPAPEWAGPASGPGDGVVGAPDWVGNVSPLISQISKERAVPVQPPAPVVVNRPPKQAAPTAPIRKGGDVQAALLIYGPKPAYPPLAKAARIQGTVHLAAVIGTDGRVIDLRATDGHPLLAAAAVDAVKHWTYRPTLLNGDPVEVVTEITVTFTLQ